jgi:hypothetical protein
MTRVSEKFCVQCDNITVHIDGVCQKHYAMAVPKIQDGRRALKDLVDKLERLQNEATWVYHTEIQRLVDKHQVELATGHMSDTWHVKTKRGKFWLTAAQKKPHPIFAELAVLDDLAEKLGQGPTNLMRFDPNATQSK